VSDDQVVLPLVDESGDTVGTLVLSRLPGHGMPLLVDRAGDAGRLAAEPVVQLEEASVYRFEVDLDAGGSLRIEPAELFDRDHADGRSGRLQPGEAVGYLPIEVYAGDHRIGKTAVEVRAAKLEYEVEFRRMLRDISEIAADALVQGFQPSSGSFTEDVSPSVDLLYRRFAVLYARLSDPDFTAAMAHLLTRPHNDWREEHEHRSSARPLRGGVELRKALARGRPRVPWPNAPSTSSLDTVPRAVEVVRHEVTADTLPNRLVKYALEDWHSVVTATANAVATSLTGAPRERGLRATGAALERIDEWLADPVLRDVGRLTVFPQGNQVLLKREGYRQLFATWVLSSDGTDVAIDLDDPLRISQRNVATLYEFWCFLQLAAATAEACGESPPSAAMFRAVSGGMALGLRQGQESRHSWAPIVRGRQLSVELFFNRTFAPTSVAGRGSWSRAMRPDCSIRIRPVSGVPGTTADILETWLHFDAKYRVDYLVEQFTPGAEDEAAVAAEAEEAERVGQSKRADLLKMHAYRDAIRRTAGAYVLFPGSANVTFQVDTELLPGIGAIPLRPGPEGESTKGLAALEGFISDVLKHVASQATRHERARYWTETIAHEGALTDVPEPPMDSLPLPPADTGVLLVRLDRVEQQDELMRSRLCRLQSDVERPSDERSYSDARFLLLYGPGARHQMLVRRASEWFAEGGELCCHVTPIEEAPAWITILQPWRLAGGDDAPVLVSWLDLAGQAVALERDAG
jgi:Domain of unknown function (DUF2357)/PD-(D/E)XK nuclease superfamily